MRLADRPKVQLANLMSRKGITSAQALGCAVWPDEPVENARGRIRSILAGRRSEHLDAVAAFFELPAEYFYQDPSS